MSLSGSTPSIRAQARKTRSGMSLWKNPSTSLPTRSWKDFMPGSAVTTVRWPWPSVHRSLIGMPRLARLAGRLVGVVNSSVWPETRPARSSSGSRHRRNVAPGADCASAPESTARASVMEAPVGAARISRFSSGCAATMPPLAAARPAPAKAESASRRDKGGAASGILRDMACSFGLRRHTRTSAVRKAKPARTGRVAVH